MRFKFFEDFRSGTYWELSVEESRKWEDSYKCDVMSIREISSIKNRFPLDVSRKYGWLVSNRLTRFSSSKLIKSSDITYISIFHPEADIYGTVFSIDSSKRVCILKFEDKYFHIIVTYDYGGNEKFKYLLADQEHGLEDFLDDLKKGII